MGLLFLAGVVSTAVSARLLLGLGLMATAAVNLAFGASSSMTAFCTLWGINGMLQVGSAAWAAALSCSAIRDHVYVNTIATMGQQLCMTMQCRCLESRSWAVSSSKMPGQQA